ncbi:hypothetical protein ACN27G_00195 [Plantactinospora sp. WMMB334]|uniref:hypothetical protein n=1 Tax=Plantactinospora sp. WMMB334 TaxID=3404119 RepID=UPI003B9520F9
MRIRTWRSAAPVLFLVAATSLPVAGCGIGAGSSDRVAPPGTETSTPKQLGPVVEAERPPASDVVELPGSLADRFEI